MNKVHLYHSVINNYEKSQLIFFKMIFNGFIEMLKFEYKTIQRL